jgi:AraC family ethanolamine operon transcriptional activator
MSIIQLAHQFSRDAARPVAADAARTERPPLRGIDEASARTPRRALVARAMGLLRDNPGEPITIAELSRMVGVSERTLRAAFRDVIGMSPKQYAIRQRLRAAREALCAADPKTTTVTDIAMAHGFFELGRFAGRYRHVFGEAPSRTLRHADSWPQTAA